LREISSLAGNEACVRVSDLDHETPTPYTLHPAPYILHPTPYTLHPSPHTLHPTPYTPHPLTHTGDEAHSEACSLAGDEVCVRVSDPDHEKGVRKERIFVGLMTSDCKLKASRGGSK